MTVTPPNLIRDPWRRLWGFFAGDGFLAAVIALVTALLIIAALLPQTPGADPVAYSRWLSEAQTRFGSLYEPLATLGLFSITTFVPFRFALALLGMCSALRLIDQPDRWRHAVQADRPASRRSILAAILAYSGLLVVLLGLLFGLFGDYRADNIVVQPGTLAPVPGTAYALRLDAVENDRASVALLRQTETVAQGAIAPRQPLVAGVTVYLARVGPALNVSATRGATETLSLQSTAASPEQPQVLLAFTPDQNLAFVAAPQVNLVLRISPTGSGEYVAQIYQSATGKDLGSQPFKPGDSLTAAGTVFTFQPAAYIIVSAANQPSHWIVAFGLMLITIGLGGLWLWPIGSAATRLDRAALTLARAAWLISLLFVWGQVIASYPYLASFNGLLTTLESSLAAWLSISGSLITPRRVRLSLLVLGLVAFGYAVFMLVSALD